MNRTTSESVKEHFDLEAKQGRRLLPDPSTVTGLGTMVKYERAAALMAEPPAHTILDIGCNRGSIELLFQQRFPERAKHTMVEGVDVSGEAIAQAESLGLAGCRFSV
jgi:methylase of polypeptide subunit release factors